MRRCPLVRSPQLVALLLGTVLGLGGTSSAQTITELPLRTGSAPYAITAGPDGNLWFVDRRWGHDMVGRMTPSGTVTEFAVQTVAGGFNDITAGPDGNLWFTENNLKIGRITPAGVVTEFPLPASGGSPISITAGPDGALWFTWLTQRGDKIGRMTTAGEVTAFDVPTTWGDAWGIAVGPDGNLWFTEYVGEKIGRITPAGEITEFPVPERLPFEITAGPDGNLWFTDGTVRIGRMTTAGAATAFPVPTADGGLGDITAGPDGNLWFTELFGNRIGRISTTGAVAEFLIPTPDAFPAGIVAGPEGSLWFTEEAGSRIGWITTTSPGAAFYTLEPCRVVDTRGPVGSWGGPPLGAGADRAFTVAGRCAIPPTAVGISANLAVTGATAAGDLRVHAGGTSLPPTSSINYGAGQTRAGNAVVRLGPLGEVLVHCDQVSGTVHFILDVSGYFN